MNLIDIKELVAKGRSEAAIKALMELTKETELESGAISISRSYRTYKRNIISGILDSNEERKEEALITRRILDLLNEYELLQIKGIKSSIDQLQTEIETVNVDEVEEARTVQDTVEQLGDLSKQVEEIEFLDPGSNEKPKILGKVGDFLNSLSDPDSKTGKVIRIVKDGVEIVQDIARTYNSVAEWVGLPQVPRLFL